MRNTSIIPFVLLVLLGIAVSRVKYEVSCLSSVWRSVNNEIDSSKDQLQVLRAEWCHLTNPERLKMLAAKYLPSMQPAQLRNIITYDHLLHNSFPTTRPVQKSSHKKLSELVNGGKNKK